MFLTDKGFKTIINNMYKEEGLTVYNSNGTLILKGLYTRIEVRQRYLTKKALGALVEITGFIPKNEEGFVFHKNEEPEFVDEPMEPEINEEYMRAQKKALFSPLYIVGNTTTYNIMQGEDEKMLINSVFKTAAAGEEMVDDGETPLEEIRYNQRHVMMKNNVMSVRATRIYPRRRRGDAVLRALMTEDILSEEEVTDNE